jgi:hypothetical protein
MILLSDYLSRYTSYYQASAALDVAANQLKRLVDKSAYIDVKTLEIYIPSATKVKGYKP